MRPWGCVYHKTRILDLNWVPRPYLEHHILQVFYVFNTFPSSFIPLLDNWPVALPWGHSQCLISVSKINLNLTSWECGYHSYCNCTNNFIFWLWHYHWYSMLNESLRFTCIVNVSFELNSYLSFESCNCECILQLCLAGLETSLRSASSPCSRDIVKQPV